MNYSLPLARLLTVVAAIGLTPYALADELVKTTDGLTINLGVTTSASLSKNPGHYDPAMHESFFSGKGPHHLVVALVDAQTGQRIEHAKVSATDQSLGLAPVRKTLQPMTVHGMVSYGNFFDLSASNLPATITVSVRRDGRGAPVSAAFQYGAGGQR